MTEEHRRRHGQMPGGLGDLGGLLPGA